MPRSLTPNLWIGYSSSCGLKKVDCLISRAKWIGFDMNYKCVWKAFVGILIFPAVLRKQEWFTGTLSIAFFMFSTGPTNLTKHVIQICPNPKTLRIVLRFGGCPNPHKSYFIDVYSVWASRKMIMILFYDIRGMALSVFLLKFQDTRLWLPVAWPDHARLAHLKSQMSRSMQDHIFVLHRRNVPTMWPQWSSIGFSKKHGIPLSQWLRLTGQVLLWPVHCKQCKKRSGMCHCFLIWIACTRKFWASVVQESGLNLLLNGAVLLQTGAQELRSYH